MSKTYHTKKSFKQKMDKIRQSREKHFSESGVTVLSTLNQQWNGFYKTIKSLSRHSSGTKASGLRQGLEGKGLVKSFRDRFGDADQQSSRLRRLRMAGKHSARLKFKKELRVIMNNLEHEM